MQCCCNDTTSNEEEAKSYIRRSYGRALRNSAGPHILEEGRKLDASRAPKLRLTVLQSETYAVGTEFRVNANGLEDAQQNGRVLIGSDLKESDIAVVDEHGVGSQHCMIQFDVPNRNYLLKDLDEGSGTFIKVTKRTALTARSVLCIGKSSIAVVLLEVAHLQLTFIEGPKKGESVSFLGDEETISVGRMPDSQLRVEEDKSLSRFHCRILHEKGEWFIEDGDGVNSSSNGTWVFTDQFFALFDGCIFKVGESLFSVRVLGPCTSLN